MESSAVKPGVREMETPKIAKREMSRKALFGDGIGTFGINTFAIGFYSIMLYYYTDVAGISAGLVGTLILISRFLDGITDLVMGNVIDKTRTKHGKARPWLLWFSIPTALVGIALFYVPNIGSTGQMVYIVVTNALFYSIGVTVLQIAFNSLMALTTRNPYDRSLMGTIRGAFGFAAGMIMSIAFIPIVNALGNNQGAWTILITIFSVVATITILIAFKSTKEIVTETVNTENERKTPIKHKLKAMTSNKYLVIVLVVQVVNVVLAGLSASAGIYYAQYIWQNINLVAVLGGVAIIPMIIGFILMAPLVKRFGKRNVVWIGTGVTILGNLVRLIDPYSIPIGMVGLIIAGFGMVPMMALLFAMLSDTIEYGEWKSGMRMEGLVNGSMNFFQKVGNGIGTAVIGWTLAFGGYTAGVEFQSMAANQSIIAINIYFPIVLSIIIFIILSFYKLDKEYPQIISDLKAREKQEDLV